LADRAFISGNYDEAARGYENYLRSTDKGPLDEVLFHLALTYALRPAPAGDWSRAAAMFKQLIEEYPTSPLKAPAMLILSLRSELDQGIADAKQRDLKVKQLTTELDRLKKIDADRRKRP
jgi:TolA-binding protein